MGIPIIDTTYAFIRRALKGKSIFQADKKHIHHLLLSYNISHRDSVSTLYIFLSVLVIIALCLSGYGFEYIYLEDDLYDMTNKGIDSMTQFTILE